MMVERYNKNVDFIIMVANMTCPIVTSNFFLNKGIMYNLSSVSISYVPSNTGLNENYVSLQLSHWLIYSRRMTHSFGLVCLTD